MNKAQELLALLEQHERITRNISYARRAGLVEELTEKILDTLRSELIGVTQEIVKLKEGI